MSGFNIRSLVPAIVQVPLRAASASRDFADAHRRLVLILLVVAAAFVAAAGSRFVFYTPLESAIPLPIAPSTDAGTRRELGKLDAERRAAERKVEALKPRGVYILIDAAHNKLYLRKGDRVLHEAVCSTGSGLLLKDPKGNRQWVFDTPRGVFTVRNKIEDPVWTKPDWAFVEEGKPIPTRYSERRDEETLGDYALYFGDGFMIHGTLYQRYLGRNITHGCVRLGDDDLERVFRAAPLGTPIYIF